MTTRMKPLGPKNELKRDIYVGKIPYLCANIISHHPLNS